MRRRIALALVAGLTMALVVPPASADTRVRIRDNHFDRHFIVILEGETVEWRNDGNNKHTVNPFPGQPGPFPGSSQSPRCIEGPPLLAQPDDCMRPGDRHAVTFAVAGTYEYFCRAHGNTSARPAPNRSATNQPCGMCGIVVVQQEQSPPPIAEPTDTPRQTSPTPTPTRSPSPSPSPDEENGNDDADGEDLAGGVGPDDGGRGLGRGAIALFAISALGGAGWWTWRAYLAPR